MKSVLLIGPGRFGRHMAQKLRDLGHEVLAVDKDEERVNAALPFMDGDMQGLAVRALQKIDALTEAEFAGLAVFAAEDE